MAARIEDYALIGDCETAALVDRNGSIDWLCWPDFSSEACFAALLGTEDNGSWRIHPASGEWKTTRRYRDHTLILETTFETAEGAFRLIDFMPIREKFSDVVRFVEGVRGEVPVRMELVLRFDYGRAVPWVTRIADGVRAIAGPNLAVLHSSIPVRGEDLKTVADFNIAAGERVWFTLTYGESFHPDPDPIDPEQALSDTQNFWQDWTSRLQYQGQYRGIVERSLIALKAMTFRPSGGVVAAVTTSLPEALGGVRNWDYRFCWLRDTTFTLLALTNAATTMKPKPGRIGCCARSRGVPSRCRSCTASKANASSSSGKWTGSPGTRTPGPCASAMRLPDSCSSTSTAKSSIASITPRVSWRATPNATFAFLSSCLSTLKAFGRTPTRASGKRAEVRSSSPTPR